MKNLYFIFILVAFSALAYSGENYQLTWSSMDQSSKVDNSQINTAIAGLPDSILQIKNVRAGVDLDQDGKKEFIVPVMWEDAGGVKRRSVYVYENSGNNSYDMVWSYQFPGVADQFVTMDVSDLDGDGNQEILAVNIPAAGDDGANLYVFEYTGTDNDYGTAPAVTWDLGSAGRDVVRVAKAGDFDNDGKQEVVLTSYQTQPAIVIASVSDFALPVWTIEAEDNTIGGTAPDIAAIGIGNLDGDSFSDIVLTEGATDKLVIIEATGADTYVNNIVDMPVAAKTVSVHGIEVGDVNGDGKDEAYIANLQGSIWVVTAPGDAAAIGTSDIHRIADTGEQWLEAGLGDLGLGGFDFVIAASNASKAVDYRYQGGANGDVTDPANYATETLVDSAVVARAVPGGVRVYGLDFAGDMDGDGLPEVVFTRGSTRGGKNAPSVFIMEVSPLSVTSLDESALNTPSKFMLNQNYPNPFNPSTVIEYGISNASQVTLTVYDIMGRSVVTLVNGAMDRGIYRVVWNGKNVNGADVSSGIYFYQIKTQFGSMTKEMQFIR